MEQEQEAQGPFDECYILLFLLYYGLKNGNSINHGCVVPLWKERVLHSDDLVSIVPIVLSAHCPAHENFQLPYSCIQVIH